jgi:hypothetical protein
MMSTPWSASCRKSSWNALAMAVASSLDSLQRIREISGLDINDPDTRFNLHLAARALTVLRTLAEDGAGVQARKPTRS